MIRRILWGLGALAVLIVIAVGALVASPALRYAALFSPWHSFDASKNPPAPDYAQTASWAATPDRPGLAASVPAETDERDLGADGKIDVFFIHPTTYLSRQNWNARFDEGGDTEARLDNGVLRLQASAFNGCCRIYAPHYRQATFYSFFGQDESARASLDLAYQDVEHAFDAYIEHFNHGRPFILAGHSQGSLHGMRLLQERIAGTPLAQRLVAAYLVGYAIPQDMGLAGIGPCRSATETGCYLTWNSVLPSAGREFWQKNALIWFDHRYQPIAGRKLTCVNPLTYQLDDTATASANLGGFGFPPDGTPLQKPIAALTGADCTDGLLIVTPPQDNPELTRGVLGGSYHIYDYNLFYLNLRQNLTVRTGAYLKRLAASDTAAPTATP
jgi:hypothetical protein